MNLMKDKNPMRRLRTEPHPRAVVLNRLLPIVWLTRRTGTASEAKEAASLEEQFEKELHQLQTQAA